MSLITISSPSDLQEYRSKIEKAALNAHEWIGQQTTDPIGFLRSVKFEKKGYHPISHHALNLIEQVNQTWTYLVALRATEYLLNRHPEARGFLLAPGAAASQDLDIMSIEPGLVGAETFAATTPSSNNKLRMDLEKLSGKAEQYKHRYVFFAAPTHPQTGPYRQYESRYPGIEVWSLEI